MRGQAIYNMSSGIPDYECLSTVSKRWNYHVLVLKSGERAVWNKKEFGLGRMARLALTQLCFHRDGASWRLSWLQACRSAGSQASGHQYRAQSDMRYSKVVREES